MHVIPGMYLLDWYGRDDENNKTGRIFKISYTERRSSRRHRFKHQTRGGRPGCRVGRGHEDKIRHR